MASSAEDATKVLDFLAVVVTLATFAVFLPALQGGFVEWDEKLLVRNASYRGWGWSQFAWILSDGRGVTYQPMTWATFQLDYLLWGMDPFGFHLTNLVLHVSSAVVLYFLCERLLTFQRAGVLAPKQLARRLVACFCALSFSIHPLRVEPIALLAARPVLLCALFVLISLFCYLRASEFVDGDARGMWWKRVCVVGYGMSLLSSVQGLALPPVLLILDIYPLKRWVPAARKWLDDAGRRFVREKIVLLAFGFAVVLLPRLVLHSPSEWFPSGWNAISPALAYLFVTPVFYLWKSLVPIGFSLYYEFSLWSIALAVSGLAAITGALIYCRARFPAVLEAWLGYLIFILSGLALGGVGLPLISDRNSYLPGLPLAMLAGSGLLAFSGFLGRGRRARLAAVLLVILPASIVLVFASVSWHQTQEWSDTETLLRNSAAAVRSAEADFRLAVYLEAKEKDDDAIAHYRRAAAIAPSRWDAHERAGVLLHKHGRIPEAIPHLRIAVTNNPKAAATRENLASGLVTIGSVAEAIQQFRKVLEISPEHNEARLKLATILALGGQLEEATSLFEQAAQREPGDAKIHSKLGEVLAAQEKLDSAIQAFRRALQIEPMNAEFHENLGRALTERGLKAEGAKHLQQAIRILQSTPTAR
jgi:protein O-mannosyl-transferase